MDIVVLVAIILILFFFVRKINKLVFLIPVVDIGFRLIDFLKNNINSPELSSFFEKYIPASIPSVINKYTEGFFTESLIWVYVIIFIIFEIKLISIFMKKN